MDNIGVLINPQSALVDEPVSVRVSGLTPHQTVTLLATLEEQGDKFYSLAWYTADRDGNVDVTAMPSHGGSYVSSYFRYLCI